MAQLFENYEWRQLDRLARNLRQLEKQTGSYRLLYQQHVIVSANLEAARTAIDHAITLIRMTMKIGRR